MDKKFGQCNIANLHVMFEKANLFEQCPVKAIAGRKECRAARTEILDNLSRDVSLDKNKVLVAAIKAHK